MTGMTYAASGVDYDAVDAFKRKAQEAAARTAGNTHRLGFTEMGDSRGESVYLTQHDFGSPLFMLGHTEEGLGTKNLVADALGPAGYPRYADIAQDTVAMIVNDVCSMGANPLTVMMHLAVSSGDWFAVEERVDALIAGWERAVTLAGAAWGGGETPILPDMLMPGVALLSGSSTAILRGSKNLISEHNIRVGDAIVMLGSSGVHANGLTLARRIAAETGYDAKLSDGRSFGDALLDPTTIYAPFIEWCQKINVQLHYAVNITGHGWRKLMRAKRPFVYVISEVPDPQPVFGFIQENGPVDDREMYGNYNMGAGFALYVDPNSADGVLQVAKMHDIPAWVAGSVEERGGEKKVIIEPKGLVYEADTMALR